MIKKLILPVLGVGALLVGGVVVPLIADSIRKTAIDVYILTPVAPDVVQVNREMWEFDAPDPKTTPDYDKKLMQVYGIPNQSKDTLVLIDKSKLIYAGGKDKAGNILRPDLVLYPVDKQKGENPWQLKTVNFGAHMLGGGGVILGTLLLALFVMSKAAAAAPPARSPAAGH